MGVTHGNKKTYPRIGSLIGFCTPEQGKYVAEKVMLVQRDHGNRAEWVFPSSIKKPKCLFFIFSVAAR